VEVSASCAIKSPFEGASRGDPLRGWSLTTTIEKQHRTGVLDAGAGRQTGFEILTGVFCILYFFHYSSIPEFHDSVV